MATATATADNREACRAAPEARAIARPWTALFGLTTVASALPLFATRWLPFADLPEHVAASATLAAMVRDEPGARATYVIDFAHSQYLLQHAVGALLTLVIGDAELATRLLLAGVAVGWALGLRALVRATGGDPRVAIFAPMVFWNRALMMGFIPFLASVPLVLFALAAFAAQTRQPTRKRAARIALLGLATFYTHVSAWILFVVIASAWATAAAIFDRREGASLPDRARAAPRRIVVRLLPIGPSAIAAAVWARAGSVAGGRAVPTSEDVGHMSLARTVRALPVWTFDVWRTHADEVFAGLWWLAFVSVVVIDVWKAHKDAPARAIPRMAWLASIPLACGILIYVATPFRVGAASMLNVRLAPVVTLFALVPLARRRHSVHFAPILLAAFACFGASGVAAFQARATSREMVGDLARLLERMEPGARVAMLDYEHSSPRLHFWPYIFAGAYHRARPGGGGGVASWSFTELPHWPLHYAPGHAPPPHHPFWVFDPAAFDAKDRAFYDYALVEGGIDPFAVTTGAEDATLPAFHAVAREGRFTLFRKTRETP